MPSPRTPSLFDAIFPKAKAARCASCGTGMDATSRFCPGCGEPAPALPASAPLTLKLEAWPREMRARATVTQNGVSRDVEISTPVLKMVLSALAASS